MLCTIACTCMHRITKDKLRGVEMGSKGTMALPWVMEFVTVFLVTVSCMGGSQVLAQESINAQEGISVWKDAILSVLFSFSVLTFMVVTINIVKWKFVTRKR